MLWSLSLIIKLIIKEQPYSTYITWMNCAVTWLEYCRYGVKLETINQSINQSWMAKININFLCFVTLNNISCQGGTNLDDIGRGSWPLTVYHKCTVYSSLKTKFCHSVQDPYLLEISLFISLSVFVARERI